MDLYTLVAQDKIALGKEIEEPAPDKLTLDIKYHLKEDEFEINSNIREGGRKDLVETFLRSQIGKGKDKRKANERDVYSIRLEWYPQNDDIIVSSDTGNKGLREGILMHYLETLDD
ncbi:MAG: hypothetical protein PVJ67_01455 [Candidatus Pacearchaeota archaeon]|jgi:hypothetical protein